MRYMVTLSELEPPLSDWFGEVTARRWRLSEAFARAGLQAGIALDGRRAYLLIDADDRPSAFLDETLGFALEGWSVSIEPLEALPANKP